jgi:hypothetical protein
MQNSSARGSLIYAKSIFLPGTAMTVHYLTADGEYPNLFLKAELKLL